jgi:hypothetical protein
MCHYPQLQPLVLVVQLGLLGIFMIIAITARDLHGVSASDAPVSPANDLVRAPPVPAGVHVAFVFAGSVRSFVHPPMYLSIKHNLVDAFCPPGASEATAGVDCHSRIFIRMSVTDNTHVGAGVNARGRMVEVDAHKYDAALTALSRLAGKANNVEHVVVDIGSDSEKVEMHKHSSYNLTMHRIYRDLDPRRYDMYFNRWSAYQMALAYERKHNMNFTWVIHARLDFMWGTPVRSHHLWSQKRMWFPDHWATDTPDTFAILPRNRSNLYYSLDAMYMDSRVGCLGGPNFDPATSHPDALQRRGYTPAMIQTVQKELCLTRFPDHSKVTSEGIVWSWSGVSEVMLRRKFEVNGVTLDNSNLGYAALYLIMVRDPLDLACHYAGIGSFIGWMHKFYKPSAAFPFLCTKLASEFRRVASPDHSRYGPNCDMHTVKSVSLLSEEPMSACLLDNAVTDWNFMPFRLRANVDDCITMNETQHHQLNLQTCRDDSVQDDAKVYYDTFQFFHLYPLSHAPQMISTNDNMCLTVSDEKLAEFLASPRARGANHVRIHVYLAPCSGPRQPPAENESNFNEKYGNINQLFKLSLHEYEHAVAHELVDSLRPNEVVFQNAARPFTHAHKQHLPDLTVLEVRWLGEGENYCLSHKDSHAFGGVTGGESVHSKHDVETDPSSLFLVHCEHVSITSNDADSKDGKALHHKSRFNHFFIAERAVNRSPLDYGV